MLKSPLTSFLKLHRSLILLRLASQISLIWSISKDENSLNRDLHGANTFKLYCITSFSRDVSLNLCFRIIKCFVKPDSREKNLVAFRRISNPFCWMWSTWNDHQACKFTISEFKDHLPIRTIDKKLPCSTQRQKKTFLFRISSEN